MGVHQPAVQPGRPEGRMERWVPSGEGRAERMLCGVGATRSGCKDQGAGSEGLGQCRVHGAVQGTRDTRSTRQVQPEREIMFARI